MSATWLAARITMVAQIAPVDQSGPRPHMHGPRMIQKQHRLMPPTETHHSTNVARNDRPFLPSSAPILTKDEFQLVQSEGRLDREFVDMSIAEFPPGPADHFREFFLPPPSKTPPSPFTLYGYSFFRTRSPKNGVSTIGQYGGSQSGFVAALSMHRPRSGESEPTTALQIRGAIAHDTPDERELAAGLRWKPARKIPVSLIFERRFRNHQTDAFAAYLAGGKSFGLPRQSNFESYFQAGLLSGKQGGPFFDLSARVDRKLGATPFVPGIGIWGGGQTGLFRIDAGPTIKSDFKIADAQFRISADWRIRIAGDAAPASGPAVTLSTSF
ncbi:hypothetical protein EUU23_12555 [Sphingorhabdus sp. IMCC26285]|uniref:Uncharacterized protein n=1 Tax=Sphingorhabdus profundilacus TaxID=2509718 RepID=A0A6I4M8U5_9SPHN|nr:hypothetical protein [Sphingorhabdus profundilacus]MVZ98525.1 hypothetical protein [Sphingorhabdus profundilacus]